MVEELTEGFYKWYRKLHGYARSYLKMGEEPLIMSLRYGGLDKLLYFEEENGMCRSFNVHNADVGREDENKLKKNYYDIVKEKLMGLGEPFSDFFDRPIFISCSIHYGNKSVHGINTKFNMIGHPFPTSEYLKKFFKVIDDYIVQPLNSATLKMA